MPTLQYDETMNDFRSPVGPAEKAQMRLLGLQKQPIVGFLARMILKGWGVSIPPATYSVPPFLPHVGTIVIHEKTRLGRNVTIFHNVTVGRGNIWTGPRSDFSGFTIEDNVVLCAGATILNSQGTLTVGAGTVIGANAVLTQSTGQNEVWAGNPARIIKKNIS